MFIPLTCPHFGHFIRSFPKSISKRTLPHSTHLIFSTTHPCEEVLHIGDERCGVFGRVLLELLSSPLAPYSLLFWRHFTHDFGVSFRPYGDYSAKRGLVPYRTEKGGKLRPTHVIQLFGKSYAVLRLEARYNKFPIIRQVIVRLYSSPCISSGSLPAAREMAVCISRTKSPALSSSSSIFFRSSSEKISS